MLSELYLALCGTSHTQLNWSLVDCDSLLTAVRLSLPQSRTLVAAKRLIEAIRLARCCELSKFPSEKTDLSLALFLPNRLNFVHTDRHWLADTCLFVWLSACLCLPVSTWLHIKTPLQICHRAATALTTSSSNLTDLSPCKLLTI